MISLPYYSNPSPLSQSSYGVGFQSFKSLIHPRKDISHIKQALLRDMILTNYYRNTNMLISQYKRASGYGIESQTVLKRHHDSTEEVSTSFLSWKRRKIGAKHRKHRIVTDNNMRPDYVLSHEPSKNRCCEGDIKQEDADSTATEYYYEEYDMRTLQEYSHLKETALGKKWYSRCEELVQFKQENGHCNIPHGYKENKKLGAWVNTQRSRYRNSLLSKECIECLEKLGFEWSPSNKLCQLWDQRYEDLVKYKKINGHCDIPKMYKENKKLAQWAVNQRYYFRNMNEEIQSSLFVERKERLIRIGFDSAYGNKINNK